MRLEFKKTVEVKKYTCYLKLSIKRERKDIQNYLANLDSFENDSVKKNIIRYIEKKGWLLNNQLTSKGQEVIDTGFIWEEEEGKYLLHCVIGDPLLGSIPLQLDRIAPDGKDMKYSSLKEEEIHKSLINTNFQIKQKDYQQFQINEISLYKEEGNTGSNTKLVWKMEEKDSLFEISGNYNLTQSIKNIYLDKVLNEVFQINNQYGVWDSHKQKLRIKFNAKDYKLMEDFYNPEINNLNTAQFSFGNFDSVRITQIPVMPIDKNNSVQWRNYLLVKKLELEYKNRDEINDIAIQISEKEEFSEYSLDSSIETIKEGCSMLEKGVAYWHFFAPYDLNPFRSKRLENTSSEFVISPQTEISFSQIASKLNLALFQGLSQIIYYDLYVMNEKQQKNFDILIKAILEEKKVRNNIHVELITQFNKKKSSEVRSVYLKNSSPWIKETDVTTISKSRLNHGRYLILTSNEKTLIWEISNSIDFIQFPDIPNLDISTIGKSRDASFRLHKDFSILYPTLRKYIESQKEGLTV